MNRAQRRAAEKVGAVVDLSKFGGMQAKEPTVIVGFCHPHGSITPQFRKCLTAVYAHDWLGRPTPRIIGELDHEASGVHVPDARCEIVEGFLAHPAEPDWLVMVDDDATFADDLLDRFLAVADPKTAPIVGALAFGVAPIKTEDGTEIFNEVMATVWELFPTIYLPADDGKVGMWFDYPQDELIRVHSTGCHCFIVHRSVLEDPRWREDGHPLPWFRVAIAGGKVVSEDQFFFVKAGALGYPTHVDTSIKTGHVKTYVADESLYLRQKFERQMYAELLAEQEGDGDVAEG